jgi:hypothetical protein
VIQKYVETAAESMVVQYDEIISSAVEAITGWEDSILLQPGRASRVTFPDGREVFAWDNEPLVEFWPVEMSMDGGKIVANRRYRLLKGEQS